MPRCETRRGGSAPLRTHPAWHLPLSIDPSAETSSARRRCRRTSNTDRAAPPVNRRRCLPAGPLGSASASVQRRVCRGGEHAARVLAPALGGVVAGVLVGAVEADVPALVH